MDVVNVPLPTPKGCCLRFVPRQGLVCAIVCLSGLVVAFTGHLYGMLCFQVNLLESLFCFTYRITHMRRNSFRYASNFREPVRGRFYWLSSVEPDLIWVFNDPKASMSELKFL